MKEPHVQRSVRKRWVRAKYYRFLLPSGVPMPELRVDAECWDRIVDGLPNGYTLPDDLFLKWMKIRVQTLAEAKPDGMVESGGGDD